MKYLHKYDTKAAHDAVYNGNDYQEPWVAKIKNDKLVTYNKPKAKVGDIIYYDGTTLKFTSKNKWNSSLGTPVAVIVIPASHMSDGKCRGMSLCNMSYVTPQTGSLGTENTNASNNGTNLYWGVSRTDVAGLTNYTKVKTTSGGTNTLGYFPSDLYKSESQITIIGDGTYDMTTQNSTDDIEAAWWRNIGDGKYTTGYDQLAISPYASDGSQNPTYLTAGQALTDMDGKANTEVLVNLSAIKNTYSGGAFSNFEGNYPAAFACSLFSTVGTNQGDWYLPAIGELGYLYTRIKRINESLAALGTSAVQFGDHTKDGSSLGNFCWSSSEYSDYIVWTLNSNGSANLNRKTNAYNNARARAFAAFDI